MKPEQQRIAIAEWCGWRLRNASSMMPRTYYHIDKAVNAQPPDYLNDLNAMHGARIGLNCLQQNQFSYELMRVMRINSDQIVESCVLFEFSNATASQRAEALLRTIGKWTDDPQAMKGE